ncbi:MAG: aldehyde ferredoxin oxidoreductase C-terminal domain-containing protein [Sphaerochaetaceae bacterium]
MATVLGNGRRYLVIDLSTETWDVRLFPVNQYQRYLGGEALALSLWSSFATNPGGIDPLGDDNPLCIVLGALVGTGVPCAVEMAMVAKSPLNSLISVCSAESGFCGMLRKAGWDAVVILGRVHRPMVLRIGPTSVEFRTCERLIGLSCSETIESLQLTVHEKALCIGPAGENRIPYACIVSDGFPLDRGGLGAVLGSKQIKAIVIQEGEVETLPTNPPAMDAGKKHIDSVCRKSQYVANMVEQGALDVMDTAMREGFAAVDNFTKRTDPRMYHLDGTECRRKYLLEPLPCRLPCPMNCRSSIPLDPKEKEILPNQDVVLMLGCNLGNYDLQLVITWYHRIIQLGLDPISTGNMLGWAMEAQRRGIIDWAPGLGFGKTDGISQTIEMIALRKGIGVQLGLGVKKLSEQVGGTDFANHVQGLEMPPYDPRGAWGQAVMVGCGGSFPFIPEIMLPRMSPQSLKGKAEWVVFQEDLTAAMHSLGICPHLAIPVLYEKGRFSAMRWKWLAVILMRLPKFSGWLMGPKVFARLFSAFSGYALSGKELMETGKRAVLLKAQLNTAMGATEAPAYIPERFLVDPQSNHSHSVVVPYKRLQRQYRRTRYRDLVKQMEN